MSALPNIRALLKPVVSFRAILQVLKSNCVWDGSFSIDWCNFHFFGRAPLYQYQALQFSLWIFLSDISQRRPCRSFSPAGLSSDKLFTGKISLNYIQPYCTGIWNSGTSGYLQVHTFHYQKSSVFLHFSGGRNTSSPITRKPPVICGCWRKIFSCWWTLSMHL